MYQSKENSSADAQVVKWPLERVLFALAGTVVLVGALLTATVSIWFLLLVAFVGINQWLYVAFGKCPASLILKRGFGLVSVIYPEPQYVPAAQRATPDKEETQS